MTNYDELIIRAIDMASQENCDGEEYAMIQECAKAIRALQVKLTASKLITTAQKKDITQLQIDCEAYRTEPPSVLQDQIDELVVQNDASQEQVKELETDASRYIWLRKEDNWADDLVGDSWVALGEASGCEFDNIVDNKIKAMGDSDA